MADDRRRTPGSRRRRVAGERRIGTRGGPRAAQEPTAETPTAETPDAEITDAEITDELELSVPPSASVPPLETAPLREPAPTLDIAVPAEVASASLRSRRWLTVAAVVLGAATALFAALSALVVTKLNYHDGVVDARRDAAAAAAADIPDVLSYDYRHLDSDVAKARVHITGSLSEKYAALTKSFQATAKQLQAQVTGTVLNVAVATATPERVQLVVFANQTTKTTKLDAPKVDQDRLGVTMRKVGDRWLISDIAVR